MSLPSSKANNRTLKEWFDKIDNGEIRLPRFQRPEAWDKNRITSLVNTVIHNLPLGITLILEVNKDNEPFVSRPLKTGPDLDTKVNEHLLDGQQRLTAFWRALHNNYERETYFVYNSEWDSFLDVIKTTEHFIEVRCQPRWMNGESKRPIWANNPKDSFLRGLIPLNLFSPNDNSEEIENWIEAAVSHQKPSETEEGAFNKLMKWNEYKNEIKNFIRDKKEIIRHYNLPYLALPLSTPKDIALQVFINMNTNSKPLSQYDIIRAEIEGVKGVSLDDYQRQLDMNFPNVKYYFDLPYLILATSALMQDKLPNQRGMWDMNKEKMIENWDLMCKGLGQMANFLSQNGIYDQSRLPTNAILAVIASLYTIIPESLDHRGRCEIIMKKYLWSSFFTDRYENSAASNAYSDFRELKNIVLKNSTENGVLYSEIDVPIFNRNKYPLSNIEELINVGWPKRENIRARGIMAIFSYLGAMDFADGTRLERQQLIDSKRHYHHVFPDHLLKQANIESYYALNCSLIKDKTNLNISNKEPYRYLKERYEWTTEEHVDARLRSHLIPINELKNGGYENLSSEDKILKLKTDFDAFLLKRAQYVWNAINLLTEGKELNANELIQKTERELTEEIID
ncbi:DUF262 domain-containing protein [Elizabethkingia anophelis]|uniref:GmrSD restriction endonuclease domain-containing protein n=1 Tax=Elizabethkingia anophelis TaxID=1117645 RepID=UPI00293C5758|nr:DUF262 domain-containing protein [Elizabethkingia anophelis]MDV3560052.1 hypothetical protein [Elizabethkingia anophelis]MDV3777092.1 hypothetical protein [Elizabethkingia anophelis]MDV3841565.1 hypothetical protein [Elizabethkingia anophelis]